MQDNDFAPGSAKVTLHGLWPGSASGNGPKNQPYSCLNGEEFDETILTAFDDLLSYFWPTNAEYNNTMDYFILSEWMKHGTCAVIPGHDGTAFRVPQKAYFRTAFVIANEFNANQALREQLQCAYLATEGWTGTDVTSVPRVPGNCIDQCFACGDHWDICPPAQLDSTVQPGLSNAPLTDKNSIAFPLLDFAMPTFMSSNNTSPWEGTWRSFGAEQLGSGKSEFAQTFTDDVLTVTTDSPYPQTCTYERRGPEELVLRCGGATPRAEDYWAQRVPDIGGLEAAFLACNHTGEPASASFYAAMETPGCSNFLMFRSKAAAAGRSASPDAARANASSPETKTKIDPSSIDNQSFYDLGSGSKGLRALYYYEDITEMQRPCFTQANGAAAWNTASDVCKAALHQNEYRNWNPFIVVFPLNERHVAAALTFAANHRLCIATAGTGHEYNSRDSCPTGGIKKVFVQTRPELVIECQFGI
ncbi:hypothetical protein N0V95_001759 [Ascochyta clinopodiicola]|nr:hypothetical protein N0V95_001759 [Ascochyta clinopodiicola]